MSLSSTSSAARHLACLIAAACLLLTACAGQRMVPAEVLDWQEHQNRILNNDNWTLQGRLNVRSSSESRTVSILWEQDAKLFNISLSGTLGMGATSIRGLEDRVVLEQGSEEPVVAADLGSLGFHYLGYEFPADSLYYWIRGIPDPTGTASYQLDDYQRLQSLTQQDMHGNTWHLRYDRYTSSGGLTLPGRIRMEHPEHALTFVISNWQLTES